MRKVGMLFLKALWQKIKQQEIKTIKLLLAKKPPTKIKNSPTKLIVPGKPKLYKKKKKYKTEKTGINVANPQNKITI